jgi:hypothetical protein
MAAGLLTGKQGRDVGGGGGGRDRARHGGGVHGCQCPGAVEVAIIITRATTALACSDAGANSFFFRHRGSQIVHSCRMCHRKESTPLGTISMHSSHTAQRLRSSERRSVHVLPRGCVVSNQILAGRILLFFFVLILLFSSLFAFPRCWISAAAYHVAPCV